MKLILLISIIFLALVMRKLVEPIVLHCCGNVKDFDYTSDDPPHKISRCMKKWTKPCTSIGSPNCCGGSDSCEQTREGGKCKKSDGSGYYIYDLNGVELEYSEEDEAEDISERQRVWRTGDDSEVDDEEFDFKNDYDHLTAMNYLLIFVIGIVIILLIVKYFLTGSTEKETSTDTYEKYIGSYGDYGDNYGDNYSYRGNDKSQSSSRYSDYL